MTAQRRPIWGLVALCLAFGSALALRADEEKPDWTALVKDLASEDGKTRIRATKAIFEQGKNAIAPLEKAGAKQITPSGTIRTRRLDMVFSLLSGFKPTPKNKATGYMSDSFGLHVELGVKRKDVAAMGKHHGFDPSRHFNANHRPACYVRLTKGKKLAEVIKQIMLREPKIVSVNLNYYDS